MCLTVSALLIVLLLVCFATRNIKTKTEDALDTELNKKEPNHVEKPVAVSGDPEDMLSDFTTSDVDYDYSSMTEYQNDGEPKEYVSDLLSDFHVIKAEVTLSARKYELSGRWYQKEIDGVLCNNTVTQGSMVHFQIEGTPNFDIKFVDKTMLETPYFAYIIDNGEPHRQKISDGHVELPDEEAHQVTLIMDGMSEREFKWSGEIGFAFSDIDGHDGIVKGVVENKKTIMFVGDSIFEGIMTLGNESKSEYNSACHSLSWYTAKKLDAEPYFIAYGSSGITEGGSFNTATNSLDYLSETRPISSTDYPKCDLIIINTGTNDFNASDKDFLEGYSELIRKIHSRYPQNAIVCMVPFKQTHAQQIREAAGKYEYAYIVETQDWNLSYSDGIHPDDEGAKRGAKLLVDFITSKGLF